MDVTQAFGLAEITEVEGRDLGAVSLAGVRQTCAGCGRDSYTGPRCTACAVAGAPSTGFAWASEGVRPCGPQIVSEPVLRTVEFSCGLLCIHEVPNPVRDLWDACDRSGWVVLEMHSRGTPAGARTVKEVWSVRFRRPGWMGYAVRAGDSWTSVCIAGDSLSPFLDLGVTELREWLVNPEQEASWYAALRERREAQALAGKTVRCPGPGECVLHLIASAFVLFGVPIAEEPHTHRANGDIKIKRSRTERVDGG